MLQRWNLGGGFIGDWFHRAKFSAAVRSSGSEERFGVSVIQSRHNRPCTETGEERQKNSADLNDGEHRDHDLRNHRHEHTDGVAFAEPETAEGIGYAIDLIA